ncbi:MAG: TlpA family protein disulfide reductase [Flavobacteriales bacterium]|jgi:thiol-disulfide isomerase/thioredoxin|nr:TlpA family protein disulfide reductase [Flavobacteriales bacterium]
MKKLSRKTKSDIIFWGILSLFMCYLFLTPSGENTRAWLTSLTLSSPKNELETVNNTVTSDWQLYSTNGDEIWLSELDRPIFVNIWATWCPPCRGELPSILELEAAFKNKVDFLLVSPNESLETLTKFKAKKGYNTTFYNAKGSIPKELFANSFPTTFIIDKNKNIVLKSIGAHDWNSENIHQTLNQLIAE